MSGGDRGKIDGAGVSGGRGAEIVRASGSGGGGKIIGVGVSDGG